MANSMLDVASLEPLVDQRDVILVTGKGGTGKSTLVAALAALAVKRRGAAVAVEFSAYRRLPDLIAADSGVKVVKIDLDTAVEPALRRLVNLPCWPRPCCATAWCASSSAPRRPCAR